GLTWDDWRSKMMPLIDQVTGAQDNFGVWPSSFTPSNALEEGSWLPFSLSEAEVNALINEAPAELRERFSADGKVSSVKSVTLEFSSAAISRPWFVSDVFQARFWRFTDATKLISNGSTPPSGDCPAYVVAIVFARKVVVEQKQAQNTRPNQNVSGGLHFNYVVKDQNMIRRVDPTVSRAVQPQRMNPQPMQPQVMRLQPLRPQNTKMAPRTVAPVRPAGIRVPTQPTGGGGALLRPGVAATVGTQQNYSRAMLYLNASMYTRLSLNPVKKPMPPPAKPPSAPPTIPDKNIYILAFICRPLSKCPNPDPTLQW
ncbi:MAG: hypothetical protein OEV70_15890, partial [Nitrospirota bacterium]|nr:hypothetical protein [Nitrospirota bacterium]